MPESSFKIKCSETASARRFSLSNPTLAALKRHVEACWGASGPSFWYVDEDGDRIQVTDDNDLDATSDQMKSSCVCLNVDFVSADAVLKSSGGGDCASPVATSQDDDGFISVEFYTEVPQPSAAATDFPDSFPEVGPLAAEDAAHDGDGDDCDAAYRRKLADAVEGLVASSGAGWSTASFRAAAHSCDPASLKLLIHSAVIASSCAAQVQHIAQAAIQRIESRMAASLHAATLQHTAAAALHPMVIAAHTRRGGNGQSLQRELAARNKIASRFAGCVAAGHPLLTSLPRQPQDVRGGKAALPRRFDPVGDCVQPNVPSALIARPPAELVDRRELCAAVLESMGFDPSDEFVRLAIDGHGGDVEATLQEILR